MLAQSTNDVVEGKKRGGSFIGASVFQFGGSQNRARRRRGWGKGWGDGVL
jgi:hypothetical protein